jgi:ubiquinone/menaquinone biosynthesis C-methylase UbiE
MKDLVENRRRLRPPRKLKLLALALRDNGPVWAAWLGLYYAASTVAELGFRRMHGRAARRDLPGTSGVRMNYEIWQHWDWSAGGEEWSLSPEWKRSLIENVLRRHIVPGRDVLEIGPGAGRWTEALLEEARSLVALDLSDACVEICRARFASAAHARFLVTRGSDLAGVADASVDAIWAFDVFVHVNTPEVEGYVAEMRRVLRRDGTAVVHHGTGREAGGWRSNLTTPALAAILDRHGFEIVSQFDGWVDRDGVRWPVGRHQDLVTVFRRRR